MGMHRGIRLRISIPAGTIFEADSDKIHYMALFRALDKTPCNPLLNASPQHWHEIIRTDPFSLLVEALPTMLPDDVTDPDDIPDDDDGPVCCPRCECTCGAR